MSDALDYKKQRRNTYGEAPHAARKNIPRAKQRQAQKERRGLRAALRSPDSDAEAVAVRLKTKHPFKKVADEPLGRVLIGSNSRAFAQGRLSESSFRARMAALRASYPSFTEDFRAYFRSPFRFVRSARVERILAEYL